MSGRRIIIVGLFSARDEGYEAALEAMAAPLAHDGNVVVGRVALRRAGNGRAVDAPIDAATYIGRTKATELAQLRRSTQADLVVVRGVPSPTQLARLREIIGCEVVASAAAPN